RLRMQCCALLVSIAKRVLLGLPARLTDERIVGRNTPIIVQADHRSGVIAWPLRALHISAIAKRDVQVSRAIEHQARTEVPPGVSLRLLPEDHFYVLESIASKLSPRDLGAYAIHAARRIRKIDPAGLAKPRVKRNIHQTALAVHGDWRQARDGSGVKPAVFDDAQPSRFRRHQGAAVGKESQAPRVLESAHQRDDAERVLRRLKRLGCRWPGDEAEQENQTALQIIHNCAPYDRTHPCPFFRRARASAQGVDRL